jgi:hypothetical protein
MTPQELAALPVGSIVRMKYDDGTPDEEGEIVQAGQTVHILWPQSHCTNVLDTNSKGWYDFIGWLEAE